MSPTVFAVPRADGAGNPAFFTIVASGFTPGTPVFIEQCDGANPHPAPPLNWFPNDHCDGATGNAPATADANGVATFAANNVNFRLTPFKGENPQGGLFNCLGANDPSPQNGNPDWRTCKVRATVNLNTSDPSDAFLDITLPDVIQPSSSAGSCTGQVGVMTFSTTANAPASLTNVTQSNIVAKGKLLKNNVSKTTLGGTCSLPARTNDANIPQPPATLTPKAVAAKLVGNPSCSPGTNGTSWPLTGTLTITMSEKYIDLVSNASKSYQVAASVSLQRDTSAVNDVWYVSGIVTKGLALGAKVGGSIWLDPVTNPKNQPSPFGTGYQLDATAANACDGGTAASVAAMMFGGGGGSGSSLRGFTAEGLTFTLPQ